MISSSQIREKMVDAIKRLSKDYSVDAKQITVILCLKTESVGDEVGVLPRYVSLVDRAPKEDLTIDKILGIKSVLGMSIDPFNTREIVPAYILASLIHFSENDKIQHMDCRISVSLLNGDNNDILLYLFDGKERVRQLPIDEAFSEEYVMKMMEQIQQ